MPESTPSQHDAYVSDYDRQVRAYGCYVADLLFGLCWEYVQPGGRLLDLGIGTGLGAAPFVKAGLRASGMDSSPEMLAACLQKGITEELKLHDLLVFPWPYLDESFDHAICLGVLHFIPDLEGVYAEARRVLKAGGLFAFSTQVPTAPDIQGPYQHLIVDGFDLFAHADNHVRAALQQAGFTLLKEQRCYVGQDLYILWVAS